MCRNIWKDDFKKCSSSLKHKVYLTTPQALKKYGIKYYEFDQKERMAVITFPKILHFGYSLGHNIGEAVNISTPSWWKKLKSVKQCHSKCIFFEDSVSKCFPKKKFLRVPRSEQI